MQVVTTGFAFMDIDAYASAVAFAELLRAQGRQAVAAGSAPFNASIPPLVQSADAQFVSQYKSTPDDRFTLVDISDPEWLDKMVDVDRVTQVIDHHPSFEDFWRQKRDVEMRIEFVGAAATLVYEQWCDAGLLDKISPTSARLLASGILDNTLNLGAIITTERDRAAYQNLAERAKLPVNWPEQYFSACQQLILSDIEQTLKDDSKPLQYPSLPQKLYVGQLALWNAQEFMQTNKDIIRATLAAEHLPWYMNLIDIHAGRSIFYCDDGAVREWLTKTLDVTFEGDTAIADRMWLRKEIMKQAIERSER